MIGESHKVDGFDVRIHSDAVWKKVDTDTVDEVITRDVYRLKQLVGQNIRNIVDVGAHIGTFTMLAGQLFPSAWIWSFEPNLEYYPYLLLNAPKNATPINMPIIGFYGQKLDRKFYPGNTDEVKWRNKAGGVFNVATLRKMCPAIDLVKMDVEEGEVEILREMEALDLVQRIPHIIGEWHFATAKAEVWRILSPTHNVEILDVDDPNGGQWNHFYAHRK
jgi:FkbM family methyltransferase